MMMLDEAMAALVVANDLPDPFTRLTEYQRVLNEVMDDAYRRGQESMLEAG